MSWVGSSGWDVALAERGVTGGGRGRRRWWWHRTRLHRTLSRTATCRRRRRWVAAADQRIARDAVVARATWYADQQAERKRQRVAPESPVFCQALYHTSAHLVPH